MLPLARWLAFWLALAGGALTCRTKSPSYQPPFLNPRNAAGQARGGPAMGWDPDHTQCRFGQKENRARKQRRRESRAEETLAVVLVGAKGRSERPERSVRGDFFRGEAVLAVLGACWGECLGNPGWDDAASLIPRCRELRGGGRERPVSEWRRRNPWRRRSFAGDEIQEQGTINGGDGDGLRVTTALGQGWCGPRADQQKT